MTRLTRILAQVIGSVALFALFAVAGWAITDWLTSDDQAGEDTIAMLEYPLVPEGDEVESTLDWITEQQAMTAEAMVEPSAAIGDPAAGGQSARVIPASSLAEATAEDPDGAAPTTTIGDEGDESSEGVPRDVFADAPYLRGRVDLTDVVIADPVGPLQIDICAGSEVLPATPAGCPPGFGGTIVPLDGHLPSEEPDVGGRPPTGLTAFGTDVLYVRAFRRSSVAEQIWVSATEPGATQTPADVCDTGGVVPERTGIGSDRRPTSTLPIDTSGGASTWPYDPAFDTMDIYRLALSGGTQYAICVYWVDDTGLQVVSYWQAISVSTASANRMKVSVSGYDTAGLPLTQDGDIRLPVEPPLAIAVQADCYGSGRLLRFDWPGSGRIVRPAPARTLCDFESMTDVLQNGGVPLSVTLEADDGPNATRDEWISIDRSDIICRSDCTERFVVGLALPDIEYEPEDAGGGPFSVERSAILPSVYRAGRLSLLVEFDADGSGARQDWLLGEPQSFDTSDQITEVPPILTNTEILPGSQHVYSIGEFSYATDRRFRIQNDVPVSIEVVLMSVNADGEVVEPCVPGGGTAPFYRSSAPSVDHTFTLEGLCLGEFHGLVVAAVDETGLEYDVSDRRYSGDRANLFFWDTHEWTGPTSSEPVYTVDLVAELQLGPLPSADSPLSWEYQVGDLEYSVWFAHHAVSPQFEGDVDRESLVAWDASGWGQSRRFPGNICQGTDFGSGIPPLRFQLVGVEAQESGARISQTISARLHEGRRTCPSYGTVVGENDLTVSGNVTLTQLLEGVTIRLGAAEYPRLVVRATSLNYVSTSIWRGPGL
jgi:hypothetical protein